MLKDMMLGVVLEVCAFLVGLVVVLHHAFDVEQFVAQPAAVVFLSPVVWSLGGGAEIRPPHTEVTL